VLRLLPKYEHVFALEKGNPGLPFDQVYDIQRLQPQDFWQQMYDEVKSELRSMGLMV
jgi:methylamine--corrinoid protein Co-methyltransferase